MSLLENTPAISWPKPIIIAPVKVARSIIPVGLNRSCVYHKISARTSRPSASVLITSTVSPFIDLITSPGRVAFPDGIFSTKPTTPTTLAFALRRASVFIAPATTPAPPISIVISSMPAAGFNEIPPVSKTTPLPTKANGASLPPPFQCMTTTLEGLTEPCPTQSNVRIPNFSNSGSSNTSTMIPSSNSANS